MGLLESLLAVANRLHIIQNESPGKEKEANWLPAPEGAFACYMRLYWPKPEALEGKTIGIPPGGTQFQQWPAFIKGCKLDGDKIRVANVDPAGAPPAVPSPRPVAMTTVTSAGRTR